MRQKKAPRRRFPGLRLKQELGQDWIDDERISVFADEGDGLAPAGVFVFRVGWW